MFISAKNIIYYESILWVAKATLIGDKINIFGTCDGFIMDDQILICISWWSLKGGHERTGKNELAATIPPIAFDNPATTIKTIRLLFFG